MTIPIRTPTRNPAAPPPTQTQRVRTAATKHADLIYFLILTALMAGVTFISSDTPEEALSFFLFYALGAIAAFTARH